MKLSANGGGFDLRVDVHALYAFAKSYLPKTSDGWAIDGMQGIFTIRDEVYGGFTGFGKFELMKYFGGDEILELPEWVTEVRPEAFEGSRVRKIILSPSLKTIPECMFLSKENRAISGGLRQVREE